MGLLETQSSPTLPARSQRSAQHKQELVIFVQVAFKTSSVRQDHPRKEKWNKDAKPWATQTFQGPVETAEPQACLSQRGRGGKSRESHLKADRGPQKDEILKKGSQAGMSSQLENAAS